MPRVIKTEADVNAFFQAATGDAELGKLLAEVTCRIGRDGYIAIERGGTGDPYSVEYEPWSDDGRKSSEVRAEVADLKRQIAAATDAAVRDKFERRLGKIAGEVCTLFIKSSFSADFRSRSDAIRKALVQFKEVANKKG